MEINPITVGFFTLAGSVIGAASGVAIAFINRRFDDRRHMRELAMKTAIQHWEKAAEFGIQRSGQTGIKESMPSLDAYIVHMVQIAELVANKRLDASNVEAELRSIRAVSRAAIQAGAPEEGRKQQPRG